MSEGEGDPQLVVFDLADLFEGEQLHAVHAGVVLCQAGEKRHGVGVVVEGGNGHLPQSGGDAAAVQLLQKRQGCGKRAAHVGAILLLRGIFDVQKPAVGMLQQGFDLLVPQASRGVQAGVDAKLVAVAEERGNKLYAA